MFAMKLLTCPAFSRSTKTVLLVCLFLLAAPSRFVLRDASAQPMPIIGTSDQCDGFVPIETAVAAALAGNLGEAAFEFALAEVIKAATGGISEGWAWVRPGDEALHFQSVTGVITESRVQAKDSPATHDSHDKIADVLVDPDFLGLLSNTGKDNRTSPEGPIRSSSSRRLGHSRASEGETSPNASIRNGRGQALETESGPTVPGYSIAATRPTLAAS